MLERLKLVENIVSQSILRRVLIFRRRSIFALIVHQHYWLSHLCFRLPSVVTFGRHVCGMNEARLPAYIIGCLIVGAPQEW